MVTGVGERRQLFKATRRKWKADEVVRPVGSRKIAWIVLRSRAKVGLALGRAGCHLEIGAEAEVCLEVILLGDDASIRELSHEVAGGFIKLSRCSQGAE